MAVHSGAASGNFWESFATNSTAASSSAPQFPSFDAWLIQFSSDFLANLTQLARDAIPADIAHLLPSPPALPPSVSAASSSETNSQVAASAAQGFREALASSTLARDPHSQSLPPTGCLSASHILAINIFAVVTIQIYCLQRLVAYVLRITSILRRLLSKLRGRHWSTDHYRYITLSLLII